MVTPLPHLPKPPLAVVPAVINHLLAQEHWARAKLVPHAGKVARLDASVLTLNLKILADGMLTLAQEDEAPAVSVAVKPANLPLILQNRERAFSYVTVEGDADFANAISQVSQGLHWEAEEDLSRLVGDIAAVRIVAGAKSALHHAKRTQQKLAENLAEYFLEEKPLLMRPQAIAEFAGDVARMRDDVERLAKRIEKLERSAQ
ncbi:MAG: sterol-binding protein [Burkholderiaceae bacterium]|nr:sterol-binding protein [Burkholderiaceae bacterium]